MIFKKEEDDPFMTMTTRAARHAKKTKRPWIWLLAGLLLALFLCTDAYFIYHFIQDKKLEQKIEAQAQTVINQIQQEHSSNGEKELLGQGDNQLTAIFYLPKNYESLPLKKPKEKLQNLADNIRKEIPDSRKAILVGSIDDQSLTDQLSQFELTIDTYHWKNETTGFEKGETFTGEEILVEKETGEAITPKKLITSNADLLGIQQVIQQELLDNAKEPNKIIDAVLNLPRIGYDSLTYQADELTIKLPENKTGTTTLSLPYDKIQAFIRTELVDPKALTTPLPTLDDNKKYIALSFDDGPGPETTPALLTILAEKNVKATFFMLGQNAEAYPDVVKQVTEQGHEVASHSYSHPQLNTLDTKTLADEIKKTDKAIYQACGILPRNLRPPYGAIDAESAKIIGKPIIQWDIDSYDWESKNTQAVIQRVNQTSYPGGIILMHDIHPSTVQAVGQVIDNLRNQGYEFVTTSDILAGKEKPLYQYFGQNDAREI